MPTPDSPKEIQKIRQWVGRILEQIEQGGLPESEDSLPLWSKKQDMVSLLSDLTALLSKLLPLEKSFEERAEKTNNYKDSLLQSDALRYYIDCEIRRREGRESNEDPDTEYWLDYPTISGQKDAEK